MIPVHDTGDRQVHHASTSVVGEYLYHSLHTTSMYVLIISKTLSSVRSQTVSCTWFTFFRYQKIYPCTGLVYDTNENRRIQYGGIQLYKTYYRTKLSWQIFCRCSNTLSSLVRFKVTENSTINNRDFDSQLNARY